MAGGAGADDLYVFDDAVIIGDVEIGPKVSVWPGVTIRGDKAPIMIKAGSNIQEHAMLHADPGYPLTSRKTSPSVTA